MAKKTKRKSRIENEPVKPDQAGRPEEDEKEEPILPPEELDPEDTFEPPKDRDLTDDEWGEVQDVEEELLKQIRRLRKVIEKADHHIQVKKGQLVKVRASKDEETAKRIEAVRPPRPGRPGKGN
ncbi:MAG: hypothetical protein AAF485_03585 [Chloroflexota bacterium]